MTIENGKIKKGMCLGLRVSLSAAVLILGAFVLYSFEYLTNLTALDNIVGFIPVTLIFISVGVCIAVIWMKHRKRFAPVSVFLVMLIALSAALFPTALRGNWRFNGRVDETSPASPDLTLYAPFADHTLAERLDTESNLKLSGDLPVLDGATALYPVYAAFARAAYEKDVYLKMPHTVVCNNTRGAYEAVISGASDIIFVAGPSASQLAAAKEAGADLRFTKIGYEAFVFLCGKTNPVENLAQQQIRNIYSGKTANWRTLGWAEGGGILAFQRPEGSGSQTGLQNLMGKLPIQAPQPAPDPSLIGNGSLLQQVSLTYNGVQPALGYSYRYYAVKMFPNPDAKFLSVDGIAPTVQNIQNKSYPLVGEVYAVTNGEPEGNVKSLLDWILSEQGQSLVEKTGYTPL